MTRLVRLTLQFRRKGDTPDPGEPGRVSTGEPGRVSTGEPGRVSTGSPSDRSPEDRAKNLEIVSAHPEYVDRAHKHGHQVHVWTVNAANDLRHCRDIGVDVVISDRPDVAVRVLAEELRRT